MIVEQERRLHIDLRNEGIDAVREVVRMAHEFLIASPILPMRGCPLFKQADLFGNDLNNVNTFIRKFAAATGLRLSAPDENQCTALALRKQD